LDDACNRGQAKTTAGAGLLGSEERLKGTGLGRGIHAAARISDFELDVRSGN
jgi:hypothetical protein